MPQSNWQAAAQHVGVRQVLPPSNIEDHYRTCRQQPVEVICCCNIGSDGYVSMKGISCKDGN